MSDRRFGVVDGASLVVASVVGAGIFTVPGYVMRLVGSGTLAVALWVLGGAIALAGALCYAELAARCPRGGAEYVYLREAFGARVGFLSGWTSFVAGFSGAIAAAAAGFAAHLVPLLPRAVPEAPVALSLIALCTCVSLAGVRMSRVATNVLTALILAGIVLLGGTGLLRPGLASRTALPLPAPSVLAALAALVPIFFTYSGWNAAAYVAGEFRHPTRDVPRALVAGTAVVTLLYVALNLAVVRTVPDGGIASGSTVVATAAGLVLGTAGTTTVSVLALVALASSVCAMIITGPRIYEAMAEAGALPRLFAASASGPSRTSVLVQSTWSALLVLTGTFEQLVTYTGFAVVLFSGAAVCALFVFRRRHGRPTTFAVPGYPFVPLAFVGCAVLIAIASVRHAPVPSLLGVVLIAGGLLVQRFAGGAARQTSPRRTSRSDPPPALAGDSAAAAARSPAAPSPAPAAAGPSPRPTNVLLEHVARAGGTHSRRYVALSAGEYGAKSSVDSVLFYNSKADVFLRLGDARRARTYHDSIRTLTVEPPRRGWLAPQLYTLPAFAEAALGDSAVAHRTLATALASARRVTRRTDLTDVLDPITMAGLYARLGQPEIAVGWLTTGLTSPVAGWCTVRVYAIHPKLLVLHGTPAFEHLLHEHRERGLARETRQLEEPCLWRRTYPRTRCSVSCMIRERAGESRNCATRARSCASLVDALG